MHTNVQVGTLFPAASERPASYRRTQLVLGIVCMAMLASVL